MRNIILSLVLVLFSSTLAIGQVQSTTYELMLKNLLSHSVNEVSVEELAPIANEVLLLDAREQKEYEVSHIKDAIWIGYDNFDNESVAELDKDKKVVVYCSVGYRSEKIAEKLESLGFKDVSNLYGGMFEWVNQEQKIEDKNGATDRIHAYDKTWGFWVEKGEKVYK